MAPLFSIITITRNDISGLKQTFESVRSQSCKDLEWVIVDGASTDGTREFLPHLASFGALVISEPDNGIYDAMSKGLTISRGRWIVFLNSGDKLANSDSLMRVGDAAGEEVDLIYGPCISVVGGRAVEKRPLGIEHLGYGMFASHQSMYYRATTAKRVGINNRYRLSGDYDFTCRFVKLSRGYKQLSVPLAIVEPGGLSETAELLGRRENWVIQRDVLRHSLARRMLTRAAYSLASAARRKLPAIYSALRK